MPIYHTHWLAWKIILIMYGVQNLLVLYWRLEQGRRSRCSGHRTEVACLKNFNKNKLTKISAYASFLGNDSADLWPDPLSRVRSTWHSTAAFSPTSFTPRKLLASIWFQAGDGVLTHPSWIINHQHFCSTLRCHFYCLTNQNLLPTGLLRQLLSSGLAKAYDSIKWPLQASTPALHHYIATASYLSTKWAKSALHSFAFRPLCYCQTANVGWMANYSLTLKLSIIVSLSVRAAQLQLSSSVSELSSS